MNKKACKAYLQLLKWIKERYLDERHSVLEEAPDLFNLPVTIIKDEKISRVPCELERKFLDIVHLLLVDAWELPTSKQWITIM